MAGFVAPESPISEPNDTATNKFVAPEKPIDEKPSIFGVVKEAAKSALYPLSIAAKPAEAAAKAFVAPEAPVADPEQFNPDPSKGPAFPNIGNYPNAKYTDPTIDDLSTVLLTRDIAKGGISAFAKIAENKAAKEAFIKAAGDIAKLPPQPELLATETSRAPTISALNAPKMEEDIAGATTHDIGATAPPMSAVNAPPKPAIEAYPKGTMGGGISPNTGKPLPKTTIWGVRGDPNEIAKLGFGPDPASIPEHIIKQKGIPIAGEPPKPPTPIFGQDVAASLPPDVQVTPSPNAINFEPSDIREINKKGKMNLPVPPEQQALPFEEAVKRGKATKPFELPSASERPLPVGGEQRVKNFASIQGTDVSKFNPLSTSSELATKTGKLEGTVRDQLQAGLKLEVEAEHKTNTINKLIRDRYQIKPASLDSEVLSVYSRNPNKAEAFAKLSETNGPEYATKIAKADGDLRQQFDTWLTEVNKVREQNGMPLIQRKADYLPQMHEMNLLTDLGLPKMIGTPEGSQLAQQILTGAEQIKASKFAHLSDIVFKHVKRQGVPDVEDAISGFEKYGREAERMIALQPHINELRKTAETIKDTYPNLAKEYINRADYIAGKEEPIDSAIKNVIGPETFNTFVEATNRMKGNLIQGNPSVPVSQLFVLPSIAGSLPVQDTMSAAVKLVANRDFRNFLIANSPTMQLRLEGQAAAALNEGKVAAALSYPSSLVDESTLMYSLAGKFIELKRAGVPTEEALKQAEQFASLTQATLSKLNTAPVLRSKTAQTMMPFMNQVLSQSRYVTTQMLKGKSFGQKAATAAKFGATGIGVATAAKLLLGDKSQKSPFEASQYVPMGPALEQGIGGPLVGSAGRILKAQNNDQRLVQAFRAVMLLQNKIPAGLVVGKAIEGIFRGHKRSAD